MRRRGLLLDLGQEVLAFVDDLLVLVVAGGLERRDDVSPTDEGGTRQQ
ncbi:MAG TPA: hypothetical protein VGP60_37210 [Amycolatopsis sp.]|nr:hypothetical protein [Amycolatopsis sp.]